MSDGGQVAALQAEIARLRAELAARHRHGMPAPAMEGQAPTVAAGSRPGPPPSAENGGRESDGSGWGIQDLSTGLSSGISAVSATVTDAYNALAVDSNSPASGSGAGMKDAALEVTWCRFEDLLVGAQRRLCLCLSDSKGCQVWDVEDPSQQQQLLNLRAAGATCLAPLYTDSDGGIQGPLDPVNICRDP